MVNDLSWVGLRIHYVSHADPKTPSDIACLHDARTPSA